MHRQTKPVCFHILVKLFYLCLCCVTTASLGLSASLLIGFNTATPLQVYSTSGTYQGDFGPSGASAGAIEGNLLYLVQPDTSGLSTSTISALNGAQQIVQSFSLPALISDVTPGANNTLWLSAYNGTVYHVTASGQILTSFTTGFQNIGIAVLGGSLYTTEGDASDGIDVRSLNGTVVSTIRTGLTSLYGLGIDPSDSTFYAGTFSDVYHLSNTGALLNTLHLPGDTRTPNGAVHDGIEVADLSSLTPGTTVPEPSTAALLFPVLLAGALFFRKRVPFPQIKAMGSMLAATLLAVVSQAQVSVTLNTSVSTVPVGDLVNLTAQASDASDSGASFTYQFSVAPGGTGSFRIVKDFYSENTLVWSPTEQEGAYDLRVVARSSAGGSQTAVQTVTALSRISGSGPVVSPTSHPLIALYSAPPCPAGQQVRVRFRDSSASPWQITPFKSCTGLSVNFFIVGMRPSTTYNLQQDLYNGPFNHPGPSISFTTGAVPSSVLASIPNHFIVKPEQPPTSLSYPVVWRSGGGGTAYDSQDNLIWYLASAAPGYYNAVTRPLPGGNLTAIFNRTTSVCPQTGQLCSDGFYLREYSPIGTLVRETNADRLNESVNALAAAQGRQPLNLHYINHEGYRLANGYTATLIENEQIADQGSGPQDVLGDAVVVLDRDFQAVWYWNSFDHLDIKRKAVLNDVCTPGQGGCPIISNRQSNGQYYSVANDWTHCNSVSYDSVDGNLLLSSRHQAWVLKLAYNNGSGDGHIVWRLGQGGDFRLADGFSTDAWFSYQHDARFAANGLLTLFDNSNVLTAQTGANSRGQAWQLDQKNLVATPTVNIDLGYISYAVGSAELLSNGNYSFGAGIINGSFAQILEFNPTTGALVSSRQLDALSYRDYRLHSMYAESLQ